MEDTPSSEEAAIQFPEKIGENYELWGKYHEIHGAEAYKWRRLAEQLSSQLIEIINIAERQGIKLPSEMDIT